MQLTKMDSRITKLAVGVAYHPSVQIQLIVQKADYGQLYNAICNLPDTVFAGIPTQLLPKRAVTVMVWNTYKSATPRLFLEHLKVLETNGLVSYEPSSTDTQTVKDDSVVYPQPTTKETTMIDPTAAFSTVNYVYGLDINTLAKDQLIAAIRKAESERNHLKGIQQESKAIKGMIATIDEAILKIVAVLDAKC